ncbi:hypothetical protein KC19_VG327000 [Ceratodon purpureus]|uniref:Secreted protein n=1 Tax=Ceratodon purpureus TaxID=3225 RepID=A0A8T0HWP4_CERPU|nr:hypothetical protein KC19_VG327000 [Ceratodon purpureus]
MKRLHCFVGAWPAVNILLTSMADGSLWGGTKNKKFLEASSAHEGKCTRFVRVAPGGES